MSQKGKDLSDLLRWIENKIIFPLMAKKPAADRKIEEAKKVVSSQEEMNKLVPKIRGDVFFLLGLLGAGFILFCVYAFVLITS